ncbi:3-phosphoshikimate 1-carboxyvinyltransferase [Zhihengliuella halotolerans]|uniref:3-phosphoshikimate 1-carboxyvinyltransferase n=1 Tax=Zhihengliuella halotolerans TaxID=370736 RepID=UPI000C80FA88|nr:3-phosphoshikimate 1-carboxyvinyltransferase [Zhihengliuella halotolerans]
MTATEPAAAPIWPAPYASSPVDATVRVPGSKSLTNRYLVLAAIADGPSLLRHPLHSRDSALMIAALEALGARIEAVDGTGAFGPDLRVTPLEPSAQAGPGTVDIDCGLAGTVMRFVPPVAALTGRPTRFDGDPHARVRPMDTVVNALRQLGFTVNDDGRGALPFIVAPGDAAAPENSTAPAHVRIDASKSSQFVSALLLVGCRLPGGLVLEHSGESVPSLDHINMTVSVLREVGVQVETTGPTEWTVSPGPVRAFDVLVEQDLSNAGPFLAAAMATGGTVRIPDWPAETTQVGDLWREILPRMGGRVDLADGTLTVTGPGRIDGIDLADSSELAPTVAAICALAEGESRLSGIAHLRGHETNRLEALVSEIKRLGGDAEETADGIIIRPLPLHGGVVDSYADHRMATFGAVLGLSVPGVEVEDIGTTSKTMPEFPELWQRMVDSAGAPDGQG